MLPSGKSYEEMRDAFRWNLPKDFNMAWDVCGKWAADDPDRVAIIDLTSGTRADTTFGELEVRASRLAHLLRESGIGFGDRVGVLRSQSVWTVAAHVALWKLGAISMPLFKLFGEDALETRLLDSGARAIITDAENADRQEVLFNRLPDLECVIIPEQEELAGYAATFPNVPTGPDTPGCLIYTSGTTGPPKGALHGHRVLPGHLPGMEMSHGLLPQSGDVLWTPADWAWIGGLFNILMPGLHHGVPVVAATMEKFSGSGCREIIESAGIRNVFFPPTALRMLKAEGCSLTGLRTVGCGGEPLGAEMLDWGKEALGLTINEFYGQTECNLVLASCNELFAPRPGFIGKAVPGHEVAVIDRDGTPVVGEEGDIAVRRGTAVMMLEYWNKPDATREKFRGDWLLTGDRGVREGEFFRFVGRDDDVITSAGYRIGPAEIEDSLIKHEAVASAGVIGKPDPERTEIVKAYVILKPGVEASDALAAELAKYVRERLSAHEYPREIEFVDTLPMTVTGKIIRKELKARAVREAGKS